MKTDNSFVSFSFFFFFLFRWGWTLCRIEKILCAIKYHSNFGTEKKFKKKLQLRGIVNVEKYYLPIKKLLPPV